MGNTVFTGSGVAIVTPFNGNTIKFDEFEKLIEFQIENETDAIIVCGTTGEASTMPDEEHIEAVRFTVEKVNKRIPVIAGVGSNNTEHGINLCEEIAKTGVDAFLNVTPYYNKGNANGLEKHFRAMTSCTDIPTILYNVPSRTGVNISIATLDKLKDIDTIVGIKEASGNFSYTTEVAANFRGRYDIYSGNDDLIVPTLSIGGKGVISVLANVMPKETHDMCQLYFDGKVKESAKLQLDLLELINRLFIEVNPVPVKTALNLMGFNVGNLRLPLAEMEEANKEKLISAMKKVNLI